MSRRIPLRPLARIIQARQSGENPDAIEAENRRIRHEAMRDSARARAESRLMVLGAFFFCAFAAIVFKMGVIGASLPEESQVSLSGGEPILSARADIVDRQGRILATNFDTYSVYAQPQDMVDPVHAADELFRIFPDLDHERLVADFTGNRKFVWIRRQISPEQMQAVHDIGDPGILFGPREMRIYPNGPLASHILGGASYGREAVNTAEVIGIAGVERTFDEFLRDPANEGAPLELSIDLTVQSAMERVLHGGMMLMNAKGAAAVLMDAHTGEIMAMASLPDFDPNDRPAVLTTGDQSDSPLFNRAVQGVYELGSTFKILAVAQGLEMNLIEPDTMIQTSPGIRMGGFTINDFHSYGAQNTVTDVIVKSSNIGTAHIAELIGPDNQRNFLKSLGILDVSPVELGEAGAGRPQLPRQWGPLETMTISYGHGVAASPLHLAASYATIANGGHLVQPTLMRGGNPIPGERIMSEETAAASLSMLRQVVTRGTASFGEVAGYEVAGKTGTADKVKPTGGYYDDKVIATFASVFPASDPKYVLVVTLDEPVDTTSNEPRRTAGWTAVPVAAELIRRVGPLLGLRPQIDNPLLTGVSLTSN
ncbi:penicillin-binding protein 2 [Marivivens donghaensis]|uniref:Penicillin-binding protein 2 n=1 Tax=Marivivens donghaensis TaxID=1699413 RepID=A0ABX0VYZ0_9RHOB|nr:penicillin-binding protein 2 [Marivivens donghaensis]NIY72990.1 penicillin-binding protein 2 [Marivivens donghaensis]